MGLKINKKISRIHWSAFVAAALCFFTSIHGYIEYKEVKYLIDHGNITPCIAINNCEKFRSGTFIKIDILSQNRQADLKVDGETCEETSIGDTIEVYCTNKFERITLLNGKEKTDNTKNLNFSILAAILGILFLLFSKKQRP